MTTHPQHIFCRLLVCSVMALSACATDWPAYDSPNIDLPPTSTTVGISKVEREWWKVFADPALDQLVADTIANNLDLAKAAANVREARANVQAAHSLQTPRLDAGGRISETRRQLTIGSEDINKSTTSGAVGLALNWELDLWGRIAQMNDSALAQLASSEHTRNAVELSVSYAITEAYFQLLAYDTQLRITQNAQRNLKDVSDLELRRWKANVGTELAYRQSVAELAGTEARIPALEASIAATELAIQVLSGRSPRQISERVVRADTMPTLPDTPREFDASLLLRRPDVASAEQLLIATHADVNVARAEHYPRVTLSSLFGLIATSSGVISGAPLYFDLTAGLTVPLYDGGLIDSKVAGTQARRDKAEAHYKYTAAIAFRETYEAMVLREASDKLYTANQRQADMRKIALTLTDKSYEAGRSSKSDVLSETIRLLNTQLLVVDARKNQFIARSQLYKALGGGF